MNAFTFRPARDFTDRHGVFVALVGDTNSGKTFSALRLGTGMARAQRRKLAVADTEGGRTLHLRKDFDFDVMMMEPPHRPEAYLAAARAAQEAGYGAIVFDSFTSEWRGIGGVLDWMDANLEAAVTRHRANAEGRGFPFDEHRTRNANKMAAAIAPKMAHKLMVSGMLGLRIPIIFAIRGEMTLDPETKKEKFKAQCSPTFLFEVTVSFRLAKGRKGIIDLSDPDAWKMEGAHRDIFRDGDLLGEDHGEKLIAWAGAGGPRPAEAPAKPAPTTVEGKVEAAVGRLDAMAEMDAVHAWIGSADRKRMMDYLRAKRPDLAVRVTDAEAAAFRRLETAEAGA